MPKRNGNREHNQRLVITLTALSRPVVLSRSARDNTGSSSRSSFTFRQTGNPRLLANEGKIQNRRRRKRDTWKRDDVKSNVEPSYGVRSVPARKVAEETGNSFDFFAVRAAKRAGVRCTCAIASGNLEKLLLIVANSATYDIYGKLNPLGREGSTRFPNLFDSKFLYLEIL